MTRPAPFPGARTEARGFTLVEVVLAMSTLAVVALLATAALRVSMRAWEAGERRAELQQETRAVAELVGQALAEAYPYRDQAALGTERPVLFEGEPDEVRFVTTAPPLFLDAPEAPFHAVVLRRGEGSELRIVERLVPAETPFAPDRGILLSGAVTRLHLEYRDEAGEWRERWDGRTAGGLPTAVRVALTIGAGARAHELPSLVVPLALGKRRA